MIVECCTHEEFMAVIAASVMKGLMFEADAHSRVIIYTGGY